MHSPGTVVAIVPARAGSKGIPGKNLRTVGGRSLVRRAVEAARAAETIDTVVVSTDGDAIAAEAEAAGATVVRRPAELAGDEASSESALLHALDVLDAARDGTGPDAPAHDDSARDGTAHGAPGPEIVVFLQATSPFVDPADLDRAVRRVRDGAADVVLAAAPSHAFLWRTTADGRAEAVNHDATTRPRRQDREPEFRETGAFTVFRAAAFREHRHRFHGRVELAVVDPALAIDVDDLADLEHADALATRHDAGHRAAHGGGAPGQTPTTVPAPNGAP
ncbi:acylneuraminate cytidylyltransferase family protein [Curtobacterium sp. MCSS17_007]|uniref:acylneuraminate cytidylyltransferase family protein n=1 Tax=Curtobacterium sp. MCSS17_007 TaxID=2175646 RepID=UPI000DAA956D|nr:acylneuraminate cytidylyltransferase family protein [Curtobacterium sp. MCSS17_007]WIE76536.1 acylneuraminate cytidylyltransferase family protein [Curtobacterium sp. MCSS17_007]